jgi:hypothetical protein
MTEKKISPQVVIDPTIQVSGPAIGLLVTGIIGAIFSIGALISLGIGFGLGWLWIHDISHHFEDFYEGVFGMGGSLVGVVVSAFVIYASLKMKDLKEWGLAVAASILAMIPCISPCCLIGLPVGIWSLVILMRPEVKETFN